MLTTLTLSCVDSWLKKVSYPVKYADVMMLFLEICFHSFITKLLHCHFRGAGINLEIKNDLAKREWALYSGCLSTGGRTSAHVTNKGLDIDLLELTCPHSPGHTRALLCEFFILTFNTEHKHDSPAGKGTRCPDEEVRVIAKEEVTSVFLNFTPGGDGGWRSMFSRDVLSDAAASGCRWGHGSAWEGHVDLMMNDCCLMFLSTTAGISQLVRVGDKATLICGNVQENAADCENTTWMFTGTTRESLELVSLGNVQGKQNHRISLSENCSLLIPKVQDRDAGVYYCQQFSSGVKQRPDALVYLSVVTCEYWG